MEIKEKIIAIIVAAVLFILIGVGGIIQLNKFTNVTGETIQLSSAIGYLNQYSSIVNGTLEVAIPSNDTVNYVNSYYNSVNAYLDANLNDENAYFLNKLKNINETMNGYGNTTPIERGELLKQINNAIAQLENDRHNLTVPLGWNCILIVIGTIGLIAEIIFLFKKVRI